MKIIILLVWKNKKDLHSKMLCRPLGSGGFYIILAFELEVGLGNL